VLNARSGGHLVKKIEGIEWLDMVLKLPLTWKWGGAALMSALLPFVFARVDAMFPDPKFSLECRKFLLEFVLAAFHQSPHFIAVLKKPIMDRIGQPYTSTAKVSHSLHFLLRDSGV
jgi:hypothetical protein